MKRGFIFAAGSFYGLRQRPEAGDLVIAADRGYLLCQSLSIVPDVLVGDFDSMDMPENFSNICRAPVEKDDTDMMLAIKMALEKGCEVIYIYGGTGGKRLDHTLANLQALLYIRRENAKGFLYGDDFVWTAMESEELCIDRTVEWGLLSLFPMGEAAEDIDLEGVQYRLKGGKLTMDFPLGVSNHILEPQARIRVGKGAVAVGWELEPLCGE